MNAMPQSERNAQNAAAHPADAKPTTTLDTILDKVVALTQQQGRPSPVHLRSWQEIERFAEKAARSGMVPRDYQSKPDAICIAIQMGSELGLAPMQALQNISVINGRPAVWGDAMIGLCRASGRAAYIKEWCEGEGDNLTHYCEAKRKDDPTPILGKFSVEDAKKAGLWGKSGPWQQYPQRMLLARARGFCLRDAFSDVLKGLGSAEEAADIPFEATGLTIPTSSPAVEAAPTPPEPMSIKRWIETSLQAALDTCDTLEKVEAVAAKKAVLKARQTGTIDDHRALDFALAAARERVAPPISRDNVYDAATEQFEAMSGMSARTLGLGES